MHSLKIFILFTISFLGYNLYAQDSISVEQQEINLLKEKVDGLEKSIEKSDQYSSLLMDEKAKQHELQYEKLDDRLSNSIWAATIIGSVIVAVFGFLGRNILREFIDKSLQSQTEKITSEKINKMITEDLIRNRVENAMKIPLKNTVKVLKDEFKAKSNQVIFDHKKTFKETMKGLNEELELRKKELENSGIANKNTDISPNEKLRLKDFKENLEETKGESEFTADDWFWKGIEERESKDFTEAIKSFKKSLDLNSEVSSTWNNLGFTKIEMQKFKEAIPDLNEAIRIDQKNVYALNNLGFANQELEKYEDSISNFDQAIKIDPNNFKVFSNRGYVKNKIEQYQDAIKDFDKAIQLNPDSPNSYAHKAYSNYKLDNIEEAELLLNKSFELSTSYGHAHFYDGLIKQRNGNILDACSAWRKAKELCVEEAQEKLDEFCSDQSSKTPKV